MTSPLFRSRAASQDDRVLVRAALGGEPAARTELAERLECIPRFLFKIHSRRGRRVPADQLADLAQTTSMVVLEKMAEFRGDAHLETWIYRTCYFQYLAHEKIARRRRPVAVAPEALEEHPSMGPAVAEEVDRQDLLRRLGEAISRLRPEQRELLEQRHFIGRGFKEIADSQRVPLGTLKNRFYRVLEVLRQELESPRREP